MTELEKIKRAKQYMEKLANGINPLDDTMTPDGDVINNVRISRCLFFVSEVLRQVIENGGIDPPSAEKKLSPIPLSIPLEDRCRFHYSEIPISASEIAKRINMLATAENMKKITYSAILNWLTEIGMMEGKFTAAGKYTKRPTETGRKSGISVEERTGRDGPYRIVVYNSEAQHFILDNLDAILALENTRTEMQDAPWTKEQDDCLMDLYEKSVPLREIARTLKRNVSVVRGRIKKLGLANP